MQSVSYRMGDRPVKQQPRLNNPRVDTSPPVRRVVREGTHHGSRVAIDRTDARIGTGETDDPEPTVESSRTSRRAWPGSSTGGGARFGSARDCPDGLEPAAPQALTCPLRSGPRARAVECRRWGRRAENNRAYAGYDDLMNGVGTAWRSLTKARLRSGCRCGILPTRISGVSYLELVHGGGLNR